MLKLVRKMLVPSLSSTLEVEDAESMEIPNDDVEDEDASHLSFCVCVCVCQASQP